MTAQLERPTRAARTPVSADDPRALSPLVRRVHERALAEVAGQASGRLVEITYGASLYGSHFAASTDERLAVAHDAVAAGQPKADVVLCANVLQHVEDPAAALRDARRLLRDNGLAIYTVPFLAHVAGAPNDLFRYSPFGLRHLFEQAGFAVDEIRPLSGFWVSATALFSHYLCQFHGGLLHRLRLVALADRFAQAVGSALARHDRSQRWTCMYLVVARTA